MGQLTEDVMEGLCCARCGVYFSNPHGHPAMCHFCKKKDPTAEMPASRFKEVE